MIYTTEQITEFMKIAREKHEDRVKASEQSYKDDVRTFQSECPHENLDIKYVIDVADCGFHVTYCTVCGKEMD